MNSYKLKFNSSFSAPSFHSIKELVNSSNMSYNSEEKFVISKQEKGMFHHVKARPIFMGFILPSISQQNSFIQSLSFWHLVPNSLVIFTPDKLQCVILSHDPQFACTTDLLAVSVCLLQYISLYFTTGLLSDWIKELYYNIEGQT